MRITNYCCKIISHILARARAVLSATGGPNDIEINPSSTFIRYLLRKLDICFKFTTTDLDNRWSDVHFVPFLFHYYCTYSKVSIKRPVLVNALVWNFLKSLKTSTISEKVDHTGLYIYLLTVSIKRPGPFLKSIYKQQVLSFFSNSRSLEQPDLIIETLEYEVTFSCNQHTSKAL
jgi:hypothetical protein